MVEAMENSEVTVETLKTLEIESRDGIPITEIDKKRILAAMDPEAVWVQRMLVARLLPRLELRRDETERALDFLFGLSEGENRFVKAWALYSLACLAAKDENLKSRVAWMLHEAYEAGSPAVRARACEGLRMLGLPLA